MLYFTAVENSLKQILLLKIQKPQKKQP
ncbi:MAG: DUF1563 domain-containing protein [Clostridiales bacterium]|nr:DUF1563 domain-containing protein [Clostridiales bacterium]